MDTNELAKTACKWKGILLAFGNFQGRNNQQSKECLNKGMGVEQVKHCSKEEIPSIARLHLKVNGSPHGETVERLESYYRKNLFDYPGYDADLPSLVIHSEDGEVMGFLGVLPRRMMYKGKVVRMAVAHDLMVDPDFGSPMAVMSLIGEFLKGKQDLSYSDRSNELAKKVWEAMGVGVSHLYSMHWLCPLRPFQHFGRRLRRKPRLKVLWWVLRPFCVVADFFTIFLWCRFLQSKQVGNGSVREMEVQSLLLSMNKCFSRGSLHPEYTESDFLWLKDFVAGNTYCGQPHGIEVLNAQGQRIGSCVYSGKARKYFNILFYWAREGAENEVFNQMLRYALSLGALSVDGRMDPKFFKSIAGYPNRIRFSQWVVVHSRDPEILNAVHRGNAVLTEMDGEFLVTVC